MASKFARHSLSNTQCSKKEVKKDDSSIIVVHRNPEMLSVVHRRSWTGRGPTTQQGPPNLGKLHPFVSGAHHVTNPAVEDSSIRPLFTSHAPISNPFVHSQSHFSNTRTSRTGASKRPRVSTRFQSAVTPIRPARLTADDAQFRDPRRRR